MLVVKGVLANPFGNPIAEAVIRFTAIVAEGSVLKGVDAECVTTKEGGYEFNLQYGRYRLEVLHEDEFHESGLILVDENLPSPITITSLVLYARPYEPPLLNPDKPVWDELYKDVLGSDEWERQAEEQVRDGDVLVNEDKSIHKNGDSYLAKETHTTGIESTVHSTQTLTYKDEYAQEASVSTSKNSTRNSSTVESLGSYTYSDGSTEAEKRVELIGSTGSTTQVMTEDKDTLDKVKGIQSTHVEGSAGSTTATYKHGENQVSTTTAVKYMDADKFVQALIEQNVKLTYSNNGFPVEAFNRLLVNPEGSVNTLQVDKHIIQAVDGFPVATFDTANREITFDSKLTFKNTDDFIGEDGWSYDWDFEYSNDQVVWKPEYVFGDLWRKERKFRFKEYDPAGTKQYIGNAIIIQLNGRDGVDGDNYYLEYEYTTAESYPSGWRPTFISGDDWRRWRSVRITPTGTELSKWQEEPMKGTDGPEGWVPEYQMFYGPDATKPLYSDSDYDGSLDDINLSHWHQNMSSGDLYKYERRVWWKTQADFEKSRKDTTMVPHVMEPWSGPSKIMPVAGEDYGDRFSQLFLYKRAATKPSDAIGTWRYNFDTVTLEPIDGNYHGWSTSVVDGLEFLWVATATAHSLSNVDSDIDNWDVDKLTSNGVKTAVGYLYQVTASSVTSVALPTSTTSYSFTTGLVTGSLGSWKSVPPNSGKGTKLWRTFAPVTAEAFTVNEPIAANDWEVATVMAESGVDGSDGTNGYNNTLVYLYQRASSTPSKPSTVSTYNFSTKTLTGFNNGWSTSVPSGTAPLYVTGATASSIGLTDTIEASEWATPVIMAQNGVGITGVVNYYAKSSSATAAPTSWATTVPTLDATNKYLWNYEKVTSSDGTSVSTPPAVIGTLSVDGVGISSVTEYYLVSSSSTGITTSTAGWTTTPQLTTTTNKYLWNYEKVTYSNGNVVNSTPVVIGTHGEAGIGITGVTNYYAKSTSSTTAPTTWATTVPVLDITNKYLWNYEKVTRSDGASIDSVPAVIGTMSVDGVGIKSVVEYYLASTSSSGVTTNTAGWTTAIQTTSTSKRYLWNYEVVKYTVGSDTVTTPVIIGTHGETGPQGVAGTNGTDGVTTYTWIRYADTATGVGISNDPTGKAYIGFAYNKTTATESNTASDYTWSLVKGEQGNQGVPGAKGADGVTTYTWIKYSDNADGTGLYDTPTTSTKYIGIATNKTTATESTNKADYTWSLFKGSDGSNGLDGLNGASIFLYQRTTATPAVPSTTCTYTFSTGVLTGVNNGWVQKIPAGTTPLWVTTATAISNTATDTITTSEWATPVIMAQSGLDGKHGAGSYVVTVANQASIPNDAGKDNHILQLSGRAAQSADILTYKDDAKTFSRSYLRGASTWSGFQFVFDGSAIVNGTLAAEALKAETTITDKLYISSTNSKTEMTLSGAGDWRIWMGSDNTANAPFKVDKYGNLYATKAIISGTIQGSTVEGSTIRGSSIEGTTIRGGTIFGSDIQANSIVTAEGYKTLSWANKEQYGSMDLITLINTQGRDKVYFCDSAGVTSTTSSTGTGLLYSTVASYNATDRGTHFRSSRRRVRMRIVGRTQTFTKTYSSSSTGDPIAISVREYVAGYVDRTIISSTLPVTASSGTIVQNGYTLTWQYFKTAEQNNNPYVGGTGLWRVDWYWTFTITDNAGVLFITTDIANKLGYAVNAGTSPNITLTVSANNASSPTDPDDY